MKKPGRQSAGSSNGEMTEVSKEQAVRPAAHGTQDELVGEEDVTPVPMGHRRAQVTAPAALTRPDPVYSTTRMGPHPTGECATTT